MIKVLDSFKSVKNIINDAKLLDIMYAIVMIGHDSGNPQWAQSNDSYYKISSILCENNLTESDVVLLNAMIYRYSNRQLTLTANHSIREGYITLGNVGESIILLKKETLRAFDELPDLEQDLCMISWNFHTKCTDFTKNLIRHNVCTQSVYDNLKYRTAPSVVKQYVSDLLGKA